MAAAQGNSRHSVVLALGTAQTLAWLVLGIGLPPGLHDAAFATLAGLCRSEARGAITGITLIAGFASMVGWSASLRSLVRWPGLIHGGEDGLTALTQAERRRPLYGWAPTCPPSRSSRETSAEDGATQIR